MGRTITDEDDSRPPPVAVLSHRYWTTRFSSDQGIVGGRSISITLPSRLSVLRNRVSTAQVRSDHRKMFQYRSRGKPQVSGERSYLKGAGNLAAENDGQVETGRNARAGTRYSEAPFQQSVLEHRAARQAQSKTRFDTLSRRTIPASQ